MTKDFRSWVFLLILALIWGSSFILMKLGMYDSEGEVVFSDFQVGALRMGIAGLVMFPFGLRNLKKIKKKQDVFYLFVVGLCGNFFPAFLFTFAETELSSGLAGMLNSFTPFFTLILGFLFFKQKILTRQILGLGVAFLGICVLVGVFDEMNEQVSLVHAGAILLATVMYGVSLNTIKHKLSHFKALEIASLSFTFLALPSILLALLSGTTEVLQTNPAAPYSFFFVTLLSVFGTCLALLLFNQIIAWKSAIFASSVTYMIPIVAVVLGVLVFQEEVSYSQFLGMFVVIGGVFLMNFQKKSKSDKI